jgi:hypothetical protein
MSITLPAELTSLPVPKFHARVHSTITKSKSKIPIRPLYKKDVVNPPKLFLKSIKIKRDEYRQDLLSIKSRPVSPLNSAKFKTLQPLDTADLINDTRNDDPLRQDHRNLKITLHIHSP